MRKRVLTALGLAAMLAMLTAGVAMADAGGRGTVTTTTQARDVLLFTQQVSNPCNGDTGTLTATAKTEVFHETSFTTSPEFWFTGTAEGTATFTPDNQEGVSLSGHFSEWFGESHNTKNDVSHDTSTFQLFGADGSHVVVHATDHLSTNAKGDVTVSFNNFDFHCG